jgi:ubiquitin C-terminal hydrolase
LREQFAERRIGDFSLIENLGNTCYMDSFVIALFMTKNFRRIVLD